MRYRYLTIYSWGLREGDQIRLADGATWTRPLTRVECPGPQNEPVRIWTRPRPAWNSSPDDRLSQYMKIRVRRPR